MILLAAAVLLVWLFKRVNLPPILAYLFCGLLVGPEVLGFFKHPEQIHVVAELGIVFLLFSLGLEFSLPKMIAMRQWVFGVGLVQVLLTTLLFTGIALLLGLSMPAAFVLGAMAALSSTAIVIKQLSEQSALQTSRGQLGVSVLLFQDLAVVPVLIVIPLLAGDTEQSLSIAITVALVKAIIVITILLAVGKWVLPRLFSEVARTRTDELFVLTTILVTLLAAGMTYYFGLSMALGAFLAGMMLGESQYRHQLEADIRPFRDILMGLFFITVGMRLELGVLAGQWYLVLFGVLVVMILKMLVIRLSAWFVRVPKQDAWSTAIKLCQMGEFSFVIAALAVTNQILSSEIASLVLSIGVISMALTPYLVDKSVGFAAAIAGDKGDAEFEVDMSIQQADISADHVIIFGFGRVGQSVSRLLKMEAIPYVAIDGDPIRVQEARVAGEPVFFGDISQKDILRSAGLEKAKMALLTFDDHHRVMGLLETIKSLNPELPVIVRTRKDYRLEELYSAGANQVVPEILEGSLMLVSYVLHLSGVPMSRILKRLRKERKEHYRHMHGFFPGEATEINYESQKKLEFMHAIILTPQAYAVGKSIGQLNMDKMRVVIHGLRRNNQEISAPGEEEVLKPGDVLVIAGKPRRVERAENFLLEGH